MTSFLLLTPQQCTITHTFALSWLIECIKVQPMLYHHSIDAIHLIVFLSELRVIFWRKIVEYLKQLDLLALHFNKCATRSLISISISMCILLKHHILSIILSYTSSPDYDLIIFTKQVLHFIPSGIRVISEKNNI